MIDVVTDLLGEILEIYEWSHSNGEHGYSLRGRGTVRAVYAADKCLHVLVEHNLGYESAAYNDRAKDGGLEIYALTEGRARVVQRCGRCFTWDQKILLARPRDDDPSEWTWVHKDGEGCRKVGHGG